MARSHPSLSSSPFSLWQPRTLRVLVQLEWILLAIAMLASVSPLGMRPSGALRPLPPGFVQLGGFPFPLMISLGAMGCIVILGLMGQRLPSDLPKPVPSKPVPSKPEPSKSARSGAIARQQWLKVGYTLVGFALSWLTILLGGRGATVFPPLLLTVVIRGCLLFPKQGRWGVAGLAFASFVVMQSMALMRLKPLGVDLMRLPRLPGSAGSRRLPPEIVDGLLRNAALNASLLFGLVLTFVLLLVGTLLNEKESRDRLAQANQQLRRYALLAEDQATLQERNRIAREMHDSVGHSLTAQSIQLENVARLLHNDPQQAEVRLQQARQLGKEALQNVRHSVASLRSHPLQGKTLTTALQHLADEFHRNTRLEIQLQGELQSTSASLPGPISEPIPGPIPGPTPGTLSALPLEIQTALYRVVQEGLTNITKHAQASCVVLSLHQTPEGLCLELSDNGVGFELDQNTTGFGLQGMAERIRAVGGTFRIVSQSGEGSRIAIAIPVF